VAAAYQDVIDLARTAEQARWAICSAAVSYLFICHLFFSTIPVGPIITKSTTGPIFAKLARSVELCLWTINLKLVFSIPQPIFLTLSTQLSFSHTSEFRFHSPDGGK